MFIVYNAHNILTMNKVLNIKTMQIKCRLNWNQWRHFRLVVYIHIIVWKQSHHTNINNETVCYKYPFILSVTPLKQSDFLASHPAHFQDNTCFKHIVSEIHGIKCESTNMENNIQCDSLFVSFKWIGLYWHHCVRCYVMRIRN